MERKMAILPPQNIEAETAILGGILLDKDALGRIVHILTIEAFYVKAHQQIYQACLTLHAQSKPTDLMTVSAWLQDQNILEKIGGINTLAQLVDRTVSAVNIDRYADLIMDKYIRRQLINAGHEITDLGYDTTQELETVFDQAEQKIFKLTQERPQEGLVPIADTLIQTFNNIENLHQNITLPGIPCGFYDLDAYTSGFQRGDLIIVAGRPSMGKTALSVCFSYNIAHSLPVAIFSLEMSKEQLSQRLLAIQTGIDSSRLRSGRLQDSDFNILGEAIGELSNLPIHIDDTPNMNVSQMRSHCRKLQSEKGQLGLVLIDYLQLMGNESSTDNRVQELSKITRSLKGLAREIKAPVIVLSQLSRGVEQRTNKRPILSDLRDSGSIEQDADIVMMIYRDEYYNSNSVDRNIAEIIISKHRNGPTGTVKLLFQSELTKFNNLAKFNH